MGVVAPVPANVVMTWHAGATTPAVQAVHELTPATVLYAPKAHAVHTREVEAAATLLYAPTEQPVHTADEVAFAWLLYVPAVQLVHVLTVESEAK